MKGILWSRNIILIILFLNFSYGNAQILGCTDALADNYDAAATQNDGSCLYAKDTINPVWTHKLPTKLNGTSGLLLENQKILTHNDHDGGKIHIFTPPNYEGMAVIDTGLKVEDFEDIGEDDEYYYLGDFGNNISGDRNNLRIFRLKKSTLPAIVVDTIAFHYEDQTSFLELQGNTSDFDCEAMIVYGDNIYLFTKQWSSRKTSVYVLPKTPGNHAAIKKSSYDVKGLITGATQLKEENLVVLCGYTVILRPFIYLLYDFQGDDFFSGNKRRIEIDFDYHQVEAISTIDGLHYFITNENFKYGVVNVPAKLHFLDLTDYLGHYISPKEEEEETIYRVFPNPVSSDSKLYVYSNKEEKINRIQIIDVTGKIVQEEFTDSFSYVIDITAPLLTGVYHLFLLEDNEVKHKTKVIIN